MDWYYAKDGKQTGPVSEAQLSELAGQGQITGETLVWRVGMTEWQPLRAANPASLTPVLQGNVKVCSHCGKVFPSDELIELNKAMVCAQCKPIVIQKMSEGVTPSRGVGNMWRLKKQLVTFSETPFPDRCAKCNAPTDGYRLKRVLYWHPPAYYLLLFCNLLILLIVVMIVRKKATLYIPLCEHHRAQRKTALWVGWGGLAGGIGLIVLGATMQSGGLALFGLFTMLAAGIYGGVRAPMVTAGKITKENVYVNGISRDFLDELPEWPGA